LAHFLIVGGTRGLGRELLKSLARKGESVSVLGRSIPRDVDVYPSSVKCWTQTLESEDSIRETIAEISSTRGKFDSLVFCQRYRADGDPWLGEFDVSLTLTKRIIDASIGCFQDSVGKSIVIVSSVFANFVDYGQPLSYHVAKAGLEQLVRYYAVHLGHLGIRVNAVAPSAFIKDESKQFYSSNGELMEFYAKSVPLGRMGTAADASQVIEFLCSASAAFVTGQTIYVDGGASLVWPESMARKAKGI
jgi:NAD(P)-dependent dehydrogenase (short-subunit alcohol dehydrogenase family)